MAQPPGQARKRPTRSVGARVVLVNGALAGWLARRAGQLLTWLPEFEPDRSRTGAALAATLASLTKGARARHEATFLGDLDGAPPVHHPLTPYLLAAGFVASGEGLQLSRAAPAMTTGGEGLHSHSGPT